MTRSLDTPRQALDAMIVAGAVFTIRERDDGLGVSFFYRVREGGDLATCRRVMASVKCKAPAFFSAFQHHVQAIAARADR